MSDLPGNFSLFEDEQPIAVAHPHAYVYWEGLLALVLTIVGGIVAYTHLSIPSFIPLQSWHLSLTVLSGGILIFLYQYVQYRYTWYIITTHRAKKYHGFLSGTFFSSSSDPVHLAEVADLSFSQSYFQRVFDTGNIYVYTSGGTDRVDIVIEDIPQFADLEAAIQEHHNAWRESYRRESADQPAA